MITTIDILEKLAIFQPQQKEGFIELNLPLLLDSTGECITVNICPAQEGFIISDGGYTFEKYNDPAQKYFTLFRSAQPAVCENIRLHGEELYATYANDASLTVALSEFTKFLLALDGFLMQSEKR